MMLLMLRTAINIGLGWLWAAAVANALHARIVPMKWIDIAVASFLIVAIPIDRYNHGMQAIEQLRASLRRGSR